MRNLDRHEPLQLFIVSEVDEAKGALAQHPLDTVATNAFGYLRCGKFVVSRRTISGRLIHGRIVVLRRFKWIAVAHGRWWSSRSTASSLRVFFHGSHCNRAVAEDH